MTATVPKERVLSTLNADGSRRWLRPWLSPGRFLTRRRVVGYGLIGLFAVLPHLRINGRPPILLDIAQREFTVGGMVFYPTDTLALALLIVTVFLTIFFLTALFGRVWCGWACPQTVYLELVYRPIERLLEGRPGRRAKAGAWRKPVKYGLFLLVSLFLAHTFLAYFVGTERLAAWIRRSPFEHPTSFLIMAATTGLMMFDFCFFREQTCVVACPYGRFQSAMLDRESLIVTYDRTRGEPRGRARPRPDTDVALRVVPGAEAAPVVGDCVDCGMCVRTCPTGIDIRDGLQMECIGCAQCIDACDAVMTKLGRPRGLIRYSSQSAVEGKPVHLIRARVIIYALLLAALGSSLGVVVATRPAAEVSLLRGPGAPFVAQADGTVDSQVRLKIRNRTNRAAAYSIELLDAPGARIIGAEAPLEVEPGRMRSEPLTIALPQNLYTMGRFDARFRVSDGDGFERVSRIMLHGPIRPRVAAPEALPDAGSEASTDG
ncbi:MAG: cytochrome c oxidase accessory protein CcoG [Phycisphaeraceae bacterium]|nr:cytochrome c oxidase accessory protein CcoG [Phycisphaeraceae bacterium]